MQKLAIAILIGAGLSVLLFAGWALSPFRNVDLENLSASLIIIVTALLTTAYGCYVAGNRAFSALVRRAWWLMTLAALCSAVAESIWLYFSSVLKINPFPSVADIFYLLAYPFLLAGILSLPYAPLKREQRVLLIIDVGIVLLVSSVFLWYFLLAGPFAEGSLGLPILLTMAYPFADLVILAGLVMLMQREVQGIERPILVFLTGGVIVGILADIAFAAMTIYRPVVPSAVLDFMFLASRWAFLAAVIWPATHPVFEALHRESFAPLLRTNLPYVCVPVGMGMAFAAVLSLIGPNLRLYGALGGSVGIIALALLRQYFVAQENHRLSREIEQLAVIDELTGVSNRRYFNEALEKEIARAQRYHRPLSLVMLDINHLKEYNDSRGHPEGDRLLRDCAQAVKAQARATDQVARYGGDEFVVILPETDVDKSRLVVDKLRRVVLATLPAVEGLGASIGCAALQPDMSAVALLEAADRAMYREKPQHMRS